MPQNFKSLGKPTALRDMLGIEKTHPITPYRLRAPYLIAPIDLTKNRPKRKLAFKFNLYEWLRDTVAGYDPFMSSFYDAWKASMFAGNINEVNSTTGQRELDAYLLRFANYARSMITDVSFIRARMSATPHHLINHEYSSSLNDHDMVCAFFCTGPGRQSAGNYRYQGYGAAHRIVQDLDSLRSGSLFYMVVHLNKLKTTRWFTIKQNAVIYNWSDLQRSHQHTGDGEPVAHFVPRSGIFIEADLPANYDASYNNQELLPFIDESGSFFNDDNTNFYRNTTYRWRVMNNHQVGAGSVSNTTDLETDWSGTCYEPPFPKANLLEYELTRDPAFVGKGKIYVADDDVCFCPHSGYPLRCTLDDKFDKNS